MRSRASIQGHPLHPMLITLPIGSFIAAFAADLIYMNRGGLFWYDAAWWLMAFGVASALAAAIPGFIDYGKVVRHTSANGIGRTHMLLNLSAVAVYALNLYWRSRYGATSGDAWGLAFGLSVLGVGILGVSGWLGGSMVYRHGIAVESEDRVRISHYDEHASERLGERMKDR